MADAVAFWPPEHLIDAITTNKTAFFREEHHFGYLREEIFPTFSGRSQRIWSAGCSTGEEPYSIAMAARDARVAVDILPTDIDTQALATARAGVYAQDKAAGLTHDFLRRHFLRGEGQNSGYVRVRPELQRMVTFERVNLVEGTWPGGGEFDVIFCRNVIIYFNRETQERLFRRFASRLMPGSAMIVGHSEPVRSRCVTQPIRPRLVCVRSTMRTCFAARPGRHARNRHCLSQLRGRHRFPLRPALSPHLTCRSITRTLRERASYLHRDVHAPLQG